MSEKLRWRIARLLDRLPGFCWAELVTWAMWRRPRRLMACRIGDVCRRDAVRGTCYCGKLTSDRRGSHTGRYQNCRCTTDVWCYCNDPQCWCQLDPDEATA